MKLGYTPVTEALQRAESQAGTSCPDSGARIGKRGKVCSGRNNWSSVSDPIIPSVSMSSQVNSGSDRIMLELHAKERAALLKTMPKQVAWPVVTGMHVLSAYDLLVRE